MILPFGSSHPDIILQEDLTTQPAGMTVLGTPTFDANGMIGTTSGDGGYFQAIAGHEDAAWAGQLTITLAGGDIASDEAFAEYSITNGESTLGYALTTKTNAGGWNDGLSINAGGALATQNRFSLNAKTGGTISNRAYFNNPKIDSSDAVLVMSWIGRSFRQFINGVDVDGQPEAAQTTARDWLYRIYLLQRQIGGSEYLSRYVKNFQVAKLPVTLAIQPLFGKAVIFGDSFSNANVSPVVSPYGFQAGKIQQVGKNLIAKGLEIGEWAVLAQGGHTVQDNGAQPLEDKRSLVADADPTIIFFQAAANDNGIFVAETFETDMKDHLTFFVNNCPHLKGIVVGDLPKNTNPGKYGDAYAIAVNQIFHALPAWWDATYPALAGKLTIANVYAAYGDDMENYGIADTLHPSALGAYNMGNAWGEAAFRIKQ